MTLPVALSGSDVIGQAKTGTGKTLGFGLPLLERVVVPADIEAGRAKPDQLTDAPQALVVVPTRELCQQVTNDLLTAGKVRAIRVLSIYGGRAYEPQVEALKKGVDVIVGTPGRLLDLAGQKKLRLSSVKALVLDEADEMLDLGFLPDVEKIIKHASGQAPDHAVLGDHAGRRSSVSPAATCRSPRTSAPPTPDDEGQTVANTTQHVFRAHSMDKPEIVARILQAEGRGLAMIFCRTKRTAADIADQLSRRGFASGAVHGDLGQGAREQALRAFRNGKVDVLVCTDVAARGIDVEGVTHVINYQSPEDEKTYLHRIGRTGRAGASGIAITLVDWDDIPRWQLINKALDLPFNDPEETYSTSAAPVRAAQHPGGHHGCPAARRAHPGRAGRRGGRGPRRDRRPRPPLPRHHPRHEERPARRTRTPRVRRRTRGGQSVDGSAPASPAEAEGAESATEPRRPRRRRRTRSGASAEADAAAVTAVDTAEGTAAETPAAEVPVAEAPAARRLPPSRAAAVPAPRRTPPRPAPPRRRPSPRPKARRRPRPPRRPRPSRAAVPAPRPPPTPPSPRPRARPPTRPPRKPRPSRAAAPVQGTTEAAAEAAVATAEGITGTDGEAPAKPRRRTRAKATETAETVSRGGGSRPGHAAPPHPGQGRHRRDGGRDGGGHDPREAAEEAPAKPRRRTRHGQGRGGGASRAARGGGRGEARTPPHPHPRGGPAGGHARGLTAHGDAHPTGPDPHHADQAPARYAHLRPAGRGTARLRRNRGGSHNAPFIHAPSRVPCIASSP